MEARVGIEPTYKGFADLSLTTWVPRPRERQYIETRTRIQPRVFRFCLAVTTTRSIRSYSYFPAPLDLP